MQLVPTFLLLSRMVGAERLKGNLSTVGIVVSDWTYYKRVRESQTNLRSITFMTWDFGGQEEYYATHQCFISRRSLYLVVWNVTHGMAGAEELRPWLLNIQVYSPSLPVPLSSSPHTVSLFLLSHRLSLPPSHFSPLPSLLLPNSTSLRSSLFNPHLITPCTHACKRLSNRSVVCPSLLSALKSPGLKIKVPE